MATEQQILDSLRHIIDPDLGRDIVSLGFVKELKIDGGKVSFTLELTTPACPVKEQFRQQAHDAVIALPDVNEVAVKLSAMERPKRPGSDINTLESVDTVIAVSSCKGGVGKSTVAAHLARAMQREGLQVGLLDADVYGPSVPTLFNIYNPQLYGQGNRLFPVEVDGLKVMSLGFLLGEQPAVLRGPIVSSYVTQILKQTDWGKLDYLIIDLPPGTGDIQLTIVQQTTLDGAIIVTTPQALSLVDVARGILMFEKVSVPVLGVVENMCAFTCANCDETHYPFGQSRQAIQQRFGLQTLAELPIMAGISSLAAKDAGADVPAFAEMAENVHRAVGMSRVEGKSLPEVEILSDRVHVKWPDGTEAAFSNHALRCACPCARCVDEFTGQKTLDDNSVSREIQAEGMETLGNYAVAFQWSDGHTSGIYAWDFLRGLAKRQDAIVS